LGPLRHPSASLRAGFEVVPFQSKFKPTHYQNYPLQAGKSRLSEFFNKQVCDGNRKNSPVGRI
jgi:hypothetical protein